MTNLGPAGATAKNMDHPLNAWYAAAWDYEVTGKAILSRTIAEKPLAFYRTSTGRPVALADACWHRLAPLSMGKLVGADEIQCPYHGLRFNSAGRCTQMPAQETINPSAMVPSYPVVERNRYIWVWPGDPTAADPDLIPDMFQMDSPEWAGDGRTIAVEANYQLVLDNLMDLTHEEFVHSSSHRAGRAERVGFRRHPRRAHRHRHPLDARHRRAAVLAQEHARQVPRLRGQGRPLADHRVPGPGHHPHRRRRRQGRHRCARRATAARASTASS